MFTDHQNGHDEAQGVSRGLSGLDNSDGAKMTEQASEAVALLKRDADFAAEASEGRDVEKILSYWSVDAVVAPPGQAPIVGRDALRGMSRAAFRSQGSTSPGRPPRSQSFPPT